MYLEGGWKPRRTPPAKRGIPDRDERVLLWLVVAAALALMIAPIGGASIVEVFAPR